MSPWELIATYQDPITAKDFALEWEARNINYTTKVSYTQGHGFDVLALKVTHY